MSFEINEIQFQKAVFNDDIVQCYSLHLPHDTVAKNARAKEYYKIIFWQMSVILL